MECRGGQARRPRQAGSQGAIAALSRVTRRPLAAADILDIWDHIAEDSVEQADRWVDKLDEKFQADRDTALDGPGA